MLEPLSEQRGPGDISLFFSTGLAALPQGSRAVELRHSTRWKVGVADGPRRAVRGGLGRSRQGAARAFRAGRGQGVELAACLGERAVQPRGARLLAEGNGA
jgi:hypothetical protein